MQCGGFPAVSTMEQSECGPITGHTQRLSWDDIAWLNAECKRAGDLALVVKGIMTAEDTAIAAGIGVDGVVSCSLHQIVRTQSYHVLLMQGFLTCVGAISP